MLSSNKLSPMDSLRRDNARVMQALVMAMRAAENWHDTLQAAEAIIEIEVCRFRPMLREAEMLCREQPMGCAEPPAQEEQARR